MAIPSPSFCRSNGEVSTSCPRAQWQYILHTYTYIHTQGNFQVCSCHFSYPSKGVARSGTWGPSPFPFGFLYVEWRGAHPITILLRWKEVVVFPSPFPFLLTWSGVVVLTSLLLLTWKVVVAFPSPFLASLHGMERWASHHYPPSDRMVRWPSHYCFPLEWRGNHPITSLLQI